MTDPAGARNPAPVFYCRPFIPAVWALAAGILAGGNWPGYAVWAVSAMAAFGAAIIPALIRDRHSRWPPLILMSMAGYVLIAPWLTSDLPENHVSRFTDSHAWEITGEVAELLPPRHEATRFVLSVIQLDNENESHDVYGLIRVTVADAIIDLPQGTRLKFKGRIRSFRNYINPGGFDYRRHMAFQRIAGSSFVRADRLHIEQSAMAKGKSLVSLFRSRASNAMDYLEDDDSRAVMKALLIGNGVTLSSDLRRIFNRCGVGHLLAISGLHIGIVGGLVFSGCLWLLHHCPLVLDRGWGRRGAALLSVGPILFYAVLAGLSPSTQRALIMVLAFMVNHFIDRDTDTLSFLALAAFVMLIWHPPVLFSISFQMSFGAVFWIVVGLARTASHTTTQGGVPCWRNRIKTFLLVTCWATVGTLPLTMTYFQEISLIGIAANCFMVPLVGMFVLPVGLLSLFILPIYDGLAGCGIELAGWALSWGLRLLKGLSAWDGAALQTFIPTGLEITCYYVFVGLMAAKPFAKRKRWVWLALFAAIGADALYWGHVRFWHRDLRVTILDVGHGNAACVEFPGGQTMLIDGGGTTDNRYFDVGARVLAPFLRYRKILQVDTVVLSHPNTDHMNGLVYVVGHFNPKEVWWTGDQVPTESCHRFVQEVARSGAAVPDLSEIMRAKIIGGVDVRILHPPATTDRAESSTPNNSNNRSIVLKLTFGTCSILFPGDIGNPAEAALVSRYSRELSSSILVAPHHGSRTASTSAFLEAVKPEIILISVGWRNHFGHPHESVLERYRRVADRIYRTDREGAISLRADGRRWQIKSQMDDFFPETVTHSHLDLR